MLERAKLKEIASKLVKDMEEAINKKHFEIADKIASILLKIDRIIES